MTANRFPCPVCEGPLREPPWPDGFPTHEICGQCGIEFGLEDANDEIRERVYAEWRLAWLEHGRRPLIGSEFDEVVRGVMRRAWGRE